MKKRFEGFSFVEILLATAIFLLVMSIAVAAIGTNMSERRRIASESSVQQAARTVIDTFRAEVASANGSKVYPDLKGTYAAIYDTAARNRVGVCFATGSQGTLYAETPALRGPTGTTTCAGDSSGEEQLLVLVSSKEVNGKERLTLKNYYVASVNRTDKFDSHKAIFYDERVFAQSTAAIPEADREIYNVLKDLPGSPYYTYKAADSKIRQKLTDDSIDVQSLDLSGRPASCLRSVTKDEAETIYRSISNEEVFSINPSLRLKYYPPVLPGNTSFFATNTGTIRWVWLRHDKPTPSSTRSEVMKWAKNALAAYIPYLSGISPSPGGTVEFPFGTYTTTNKDRVAREWPSNNENARSLGMVDNPPTADNTKITGDCSRYFRGPILRVAVSVKQTKKMVRSDPNNPTSPLVPAEPSEAENQISRQEAELPIVTRN